MSTCVECALLNKEEERSDKGYCYMWAYWPSNETCCEFRRKSNKPLGSDAKEPAQVS